VASTAGLGNDAGELVNLGLGATKGAESLLGQLPCALILAVAEEFDDTLLVRGKASNLLDNLTHESSPPAQAALGPRDAGLVDTSSCLMTLVEADGETSPGSLFLGHCGRRLIE